jgi:Ser/Thr protein kinase RdoA (MazF antagonist)
VTEKISVPSTDGATVGVIDPRSFETVLASYGLTGATVTHLGTSENVTLRTFAENHAAVLRIYRIGHRSRSAIEAELAWMDALRRDAGVSTPETLRTRSDERISPLATTGGDTYCVAFRPLPGKEPPEDRLQGWFHELGILCARMHDHASTWAHLAALDRPRLDWNTLIGAAAIWGPWSRAQRLGPATMPTLHRVAERIRSRLQGYGTSERVYGLIHGDLRLQNLLVDDHTVHVIDFDDCSFCWWLYDLATALSLIEDLPTAPRLLHSWLEGYCSRRPLQPQDLEIIPDLIMMRRMQVLGWLGSRSHTKLAQEVSPWYVPATVAAAEDYLSGRPRLCPGVG